MIRTWPRFSLGAFDASTLGSIADKVVWVFFYEGYGQVQPIQSIVLIARVPSQIPSPKYQCTRSAAAFVFAM